MPKKGLIRGPKKRRLEISLEFYYENSYCKDGKREGQWKVE